MNPQKDLNFSSAEIKYTLQETNVTMKKDQQLLINIAREGSLIIELIKNWILRGYIIYVSCIVVI